MRQDGCPDCDRLWKQYEKAVMTHTRLESKVKVAKLRFEKEMAELENSMAAAIAERHRLKQEILEHESKAHPATKPSF